MMTSKSLSGRRAIDSAFFRKPIGVRVLHHA
jgi:hypothetical protein